VISRIGRTYMALSASEIADLRTARNLLENPGLAARLSSLVGAPIEAGFRRLPESLHGAINAAARTSIEKALNVALLTMDRDGCGVPSNWWHKVAVGATGATGGVFGLSALAIELPVSTAIMLRSIADIARSQGEDLRHPDARLQCIQVLALGGQSKGDDPAEAGYFAARAALAKAVSEAAEHLARKGLARKGAPALVRLITQVAARFSVVVSQKAAAQAVPLLGALGGAAINALFIDHFQDMGRGHFIIRRLERIHGQEEVRRMYGELG
jgi:hypothetical protein